MKNNICPKCNRKHNKFPRTCYYEAHSDNVHCVITKLASLGTAEQSEFAKQAEVAWHKMRQYALTNFPNEPALKE